MANPEAHTSKRPLGGLFVAIGVIAIVYSALFFVSSAINYGDTKRFQYEGKRITGVIDSVQGAEVLRNFKVTYHYSDETGAAHTTTEGYRFADAGTLHPGQSLDVVYLLRQPDHSRLAANQEESMIQQKEVPWITICGVALGGLFSLGIGFTKLQQQWQS